MFTVIHEISTHQSACCQTRAAAPLFARGGTERGSERRLVRAVPNTERRRRGEERNGPRSEEPVITDVPSPRGEHSLLGGQ